MKATFTEWLRPENIIIKKIEYFKDKYQKEFDDETKRINKLKEIAESKNKESELKTLNELMEKYKEEINFNNKESKEYGKRKFTFCFYLRM